MYNIPLLMGAPASSTGGSPQGSIVQIGMIVAVFAVFWLLIIRPQKKKQRQTRDMIAAIQRGDRVTSIGGICGVVKNVTDTTVIVEIDKKGTTLELVKSAIGSVNRNDSAPIEKEPEPVKDSAKDE